MLAEKITELLAGSRFASATVDAIKNWDGADLATVKWSWKDDERAAIVSFIRSAGFKTDDRVAYVLVTS